MTIREIIAIALAPDSRGLCAIVIVGGLIIAMAGCIPEFAR